MSTALAVVLGVVLGALGGAVHLAVTRWRASLATARGAAVALGAMPIGLVGLGAFVWAAAWASPIAAWATPIGILGVRIAVLRRARR
jgi:hypothetical protein